MKLGRKFTDQLWQPGSRYVSSISVIEHPDPEKAEESKKVKKVPFGFSRALEKS